MARRISQLDVQTRTLIDAAADEARREAQRLMRHTYVAWGLGFGVFAVVLFSLFLFGESLPLWSAPIFAFAAPTTMVVSGAVILWIWRNAGAGRYKSILVRRVVEVLGEGATYSPDAPLTAGEIDALGIFPHRARRVEAGDEIAGKRGDVGFRYLEIRAAGVLRSGGVRPKHPRRFEGYLLVLSFKKLFRGHTVVIPDHEAKLLWMDVSTHQGKPRVPMENPEFERVFSVFATDDQQARDALTPKVVEVLIVTRRRLGRDVRACFLGNTLVLACTSTRDRFEQNIGPGRDVDPQRVATELQEVLALVDQVVEAMDLETGTWTRH